MEIIERWKGMPNFSVWFPQEWDKVKTSILKVASKELSRYRRCTVEELNEEWIRFIFEKRGGGRGAIEFGTEELREMSAKSLADSLRRMKRYASDSERSLLQLVFNEFKQIVKWPYSREMSLKIREAGLDYYYSVANDIGADYIRVGEERVAEATSSLTVRAIHLCEGSQDELNSFLQSLKIFIERYIKSPRNPVVNFEDLVKQGIFAPPQSEKASLMISEEGNLWTGAGGYNGKRVSFTVAPSILEFDKVETIQDYLRVQAAFSRGDESGTHPVDTVELTPGANATQMKYDLFISYSKPDRVEALRIKEEAEARSLICFLSEKSIKSGSDWDEEIFEDALPSSREVAFLMTPDSINKPWILAEWGGVKALRKRYTPILFRCSPGDLPLNMRERQARDFGDLKTFIAEVLSRKNA